MLSCPQPSRSRTLAPRPWILPLAASASGGAAARSAAARSRALVALRAGGSVPAKVAEHTRGAQATGAEATHAHCQRFTARAKRAPPAAWPCAARRFVARGPSTRPVQRSEAAHGSPRRRARPSEARRARPLAARARAGRAPYGPRRLTEPSVAVKGRGAAQRARDPEAEGVPPRSEAQREMKSPGYGNGPLPDSDHARQRVDAARVTGMGKLGPRPARAPQSARLPHPFRRSAAGRR